MFQSCQVTHFVDKDKIEFRTVIKIYFKIKLPTEIKAAGNCVYADLCKNLACEI